MNRPIHETMRAAGQGLLGGAAAGTLIGLAVIYLNPIALAVGLLAAGAGLITAANALKRREQRARKGLQ